MAFNLLRQTPKMNCQDKSQNGIIVECNQFSLGLGDLDWKRMLLGLPFAFFFFTFEDQIKTRRLEYICLPSLI